MRMHKKVKLLLLVSSFTIIHNIADAQWLTGTGSDIYYNGGNVGIGTASPQFKLHTQTNTTVGFAVQNTITPGVSSGAFIRLYNSGTPSAGSQRLGGLLFSTNPTGTTYRDGAVFLEAYSEAAWTDGTSHPAFMRIMTTPTGSINALERMRITAAGNVGIGTTTPGDRLNVVTPGGADGIGIQSTLAFGGGSGAFLRLYNSGTPSAANQRMGGILWGANPTGTTRRTGAQIEGSSEAAWTDNVSHPTYLRFLTVPSGSTTVTERMRITAAGNVGIGTTTPGTYKLAVEGTIGARRMKVTQAAWADFVFHPDYELPSLVEVEQFVKTNQHLPGIPSEKEVKENGLDLGEMNKQLLQKVEELTLYIIQLKKDSEAQLQMINQLQQTIKK